ncbi:hypothetical protein MLD38_030855 [Melastoma candidum]|uniref:Uncharacterized protein n=1 Tax=Melastoma candidum TaxID=119954 RepID=A0ACB9MRH0_9MYRT|nr:hypothetical protein MLD38_030855 [Melastoma candidum]
MEKEPEPRPSHDRSSLLSAYYAPSSQRPLLPHVAEFTLKFLRDGRITLWPGNLARTASIFEGAVGEKNVVQDEDALEAVNTDWMHKYRGSSRLMLHPRNADEVQFFHCDKRCFAVVPQGGNTGLVGGSVPVYDKDYQQLVSLWPV